MVSEIEKLHATVARLEREKNRAQRREQTARSKLAKAERSADAKGKILDGAVFRLGAEHDPAIAALLLRLREEELIRDADREFFGLPPLSDAEKAAHPNAANLRRGGRRKRNGKAASSDGSAPSPASDNPAAPEPVMALETEAA